MKRLYRSPNDRKLAGVCGGLGEYFEQYVTEPGTRQKKKKRENWRWSFTANVPVWLVFALGGATWLITAGLFVQLFRRTFGFDEKHLPLFVFMAGSPFFLKNFMHTLGHFDIYGCLLAIILLPTARSMAYVLLAALFSIVLVLIHHIHLLMYVPTIAAIVVMRHYLVHGADRQNVTAGIVALSAIGVLFIAAQFYGTMKVPESAFTAYLQGRMADPSQTNLLSFAYIWYQPLTKEISGPRPACRIICSARHCSRC